MKSNKTMLRRLALVLVFALVFTTLFQTSVSAASKTKVVKTQKELSAALKDKGITKIIIRTDKKVELSIPKKGYGKKTLVIEAPKATLKNKGSFRSITIKDATKYYEQGEENSIKVTDNKLTFNVPTGTQVKKLVLAGEDASYRVNLNGTLPDIRVTKKADIALNGTTSDSVIVRNTADGTELKSSVQTDLRNWNEMSVQFQEGAAKSKVTTKGDIDVVAAKEVPLARVTACEDHVKVTVRAAETVAKVNVNAENAEVVVNAGGKVSEVNVNAAAKVSLDTDGEVGSMNVNAAKANVSLKAEGEVSKVNIAKEAVGAKVDIQANNKVQNVNVNAAADLTLSGNGEANVTIATGAEGAKVEASMQVEVKAEANASVNLKEGAEGSKVTTTKDETKVLVENKTKEELKVETPTGTETVKVDTSIQTGKTDTTTPDSGDNTGGSGTGGSGTGGSGTGGTGTGGSGTVVVPDYTPPQPSLSAACDITAFAVSAAGIEEVITGTIEGTTITLKLTKACVVDTVTIASITLSDKATTDKGTGAGVSPFDSANNTITVTAENGTKKTYTIATKYELDLAAALGEKITAFGTAYYNKLGGKYYKDTESGWQTYSNGSWSATSEFSGDAAYFELGNVGLNVASVTIGSQELLGTQVVPTSVGNNSWIYGYPVKMKDGALNLFLPALMSEMASGKMDLTVKGTTEAGAERVLSLSLILLSTESEFRSLTPTVVSQAGVEATTAAAAVYNNSSYAKIEGATATYEITGNVCTVTVDPASSGVDAASMTALVGICFQDGETLIQGNANTPIFRKTVAGGTITQYGYMTGNVDASGQKVNDYLYEVYTKAPGTSEEFHMVFPGKGACGTVTFTVVTKDAP